MAGLRNWAHTLQAELRSRGIHVATVTIASGVIAGDPIAGPDLIGARYYQLHSRRDRAEEVIGDLDAFRRLVTEWTSNHGRHCRSLASDAR